MRFTVPSFPVVSENSELLKEVGFRKSDYSFFYTANGQQRPLTLKPVTIASGEKIVAYNMSDEAGEWDAMHFDTEMKCHFDFGDVAAFFGKSGIAVHDAAIGLAVMIISLTSNHRFCKPIMSFCEDSGKVSRDWSFVLPKAFYRDRIIFQTVLYIKKTGFPKDYEDIRANTSGMIVGDLGAMTVFVDGTGSLFPVKKENDASKPLWRVECNWSDPTMDMFSEENVCVIFNQAHPNYPLLKLEAGMNGSPFLVDVLASALQIIIWKVLESVGNDVDQLVNPTQTIAPGSIIDAVHYFLKTFEWDVSSPERFAASIRKDFDGRTGNDQ